MASIVPDGLYFCVLTLFEYRNIIRNQRSGCPPPPQISGKHPFALITKCLCFFPMVLKKIHDDDNVHQDRKEIRMAAERSAVSVTQGTPTWEGREGRMKECVWVEGLFICRETQNEMGHSFRWIYRNKAN